MLLFKCTIYTRTLISTFFACELGNVKLMLLNPGAFCRKQILPSLINDLFLSKTRQ